MKKFLSFLLVAIMVLSVVPAIAATDELLTNPGFETGDETGYTTYGSCNIEVGEEYAHKGDYGMLISQRANGYSTWAQDISNVLILNGPGEYIASVWIKLAEGQEPCTVHLTLNIQSNDADKATYYTSGRKTLTTEWQQFTFKGNIDFDPIYGFKTALIYQQSEGGKGAPDIMIDDFSLKKTSEVNGIPLDEVIVPEGGTAPTTKPSSTKNKELLINPGFEEGDETGFEQYGASSNMEVGEDYARTGEYGMLLSDRMGKYATWAQDITEQLILNGPGEYFGSVWMKLSEDSKTSGKAQLVINVKPNGGVQKYYGSAQKQLTYEWQEFAFKGTIDFDPKKGFEIALIYQQSEAMPDIMIDDFTFKKTSAVNGISLDEVEKDEYPDVEMSHVNAFLQEREEKTTIGAIRWDAWYTHDGRAESIVSQVENTLSPAEYHWRAPFFSIITEDGKIQMPEYTQEIFDREMEYAMEAGLSYFAYLYYTGPMGTARKLHATSKYNKDVKMVMCLDGNSIGKSEAREEIKEHLKQDYYMTVLNDRPLMYYYVNTGKREENMALVASEIKYYRGYCQSVGLPEPFVVCMNITGQETQTIYGDAVSRYSIGGTSDMTFNDFITTAQSQWEGYQKSGMQYVPMMTFGWHAEPRYKNPVTWMDVDENSWVPYPTDEEIYNHTMYALSYMDHPSTTEFTKLNTLILYAWNEHDEGSWLCPTLKVDENGNQLYNEDGTPMVDDSRIQMVKKAFEDYNNGQRTEIVINGISNIKKTETATPEPEKGSSNIDVNNNNIDNNIEKPDLTIYIVIGLGAIFVIGGTIGLIIAVKVLKKKKEGKSNEQNK